MQPFHNPLYCSPGCVTDTRSFSTVAKQRVPADAEIRFASMEWSNGTSVWHETPTNHSLKLCLELIREQTTQFLPATGKAFKPLPFLLNYRLNSPRCWGFGSADGLPATLPNSAPNKIWELILTTTPEAAKLREAEHHQQPLNVFCQVFPSPSPVKRS